MILQIFPAEQLNFEFFSLEVNTTPMPDHFVQALITKIEVSARYSDQNKSIRLTITTYAESHISSTNFAYMI